jgi:hypothetical protein
MKKAASYRDRAVASYREAGHLVGKLKKMNGEAKLLVDGLSGT